MASAALAALATTTGATVLEEAVLQGLSDPGRVDQEDLVDHLGPEALLGTKTQDFPFRESAG